MTKPALFSRRINATARHADDFYITAPWMTRALLQQLPPLAGRLLLEPCAGDGAIVRELPRAARVLSNDLVPRAPLSPTFLLDAREATAWRTFRRCGPIDVVVSNPPFKWAFEIARRAFEAARLCVALLLRLSWLEPTGSRGAWLRAHPPTRLIVLPRYSFRRNGKSDSVTCAWVIWSKHRLFCAPGIDFVTRADRDRLVAMKRGALKAAA